MKVIYEHLITDEKINGGNVTIKGTRIEPKHIVNYGTMEEIMNDFQLTKDQVIEAYHYEMARNMTKEDGENMRKDWEAVGDYFKDAMKRIEQVIDRKNK